MITERPYNIKQLLSDSPLGGAQQLYEQALALDPDFALAHASLSNVHGRTYWLGYDPYPARAERQRREAEAALRLAPDLPQAHWAMGMAYFWGRRDYRRALDELTIAVEKLPGSAELWAYVGLTHRRLGNWDRVQAAFEKATSLDPRGANMFEDLGGNTYRTLHRYREAVAAYSRALALAPDLGAADLRRALVYISWLGPLDSLRVVLERGPEGYSYFGSAVSWRARLALWERRADALLALLAAQPEPVIFEAQDMVRARTTVCGLGAPAAEGQRVCGRSVSRRACAVGFGVGRPSERLSAARGPWVRTGWLGAAG